MWEFILFESRLFLKEKKTWTLVAFLIVGLSGLIFYIPYQGVGHIPQKLAIDILNNTANMYEFSEIEAEDPLIRPSYENVLFQQRLIARQDVFYRFDQPEQYIETGIELAELRIEGHEQGFKGMDSRYLVSGEQAQKDQAFYQYLADRQLLIQNDGQNGATYVAEALNFTGIGLFFVALLLSGDILTKEDDHRSLAKSLPLANKKKVTTKLIVYTLLPWVGTVTLISGFTGVMSGLFETGNFFYPIIVYANTQFQGISTLLYIGLFMGYGLVLFLHVGLLTLVLNQVTKNMYLTLFIGSVLYFLPYILPSTFTLHYLLPFSYYNLTDVLNGTLAEKLHPAIDYMSGLSVLLASSLLLLIVFGWLQHSQKQMKVKGGGSR